MEHIKEDILFSLIDESIDESDRKAHEEHITDCDNCFSMYATLKSSYTEITKAELQPTPSDLFEKAEAEL